MLYPRCKNHSGGQFESCSGATLYTCLNLIQVHRRKIHGIESIAGEGQHGAVIGLHIRSFLVECYHFKSFYYFCCQLSSTASVISNHALLLLKSAGYTQPYFNGEGVPT